MLLVPFSLTGGQAGAGTHQNQYLSQHFLLAKLLSLIE